MDYEALAHEAILELLGHTPRLSLKKTSEFSRGEVRLLEYLFLIRDGMTAGELSEKMNISTARVAATLKSLEKKGLIVRRADERDRRKTVVCLTAEGRKTGREKYETLRRHMGGLFRALGEPDAAELLRLVRRVLSLSPEAEGGDGERARAACVTADRAPIDPGEKGRIE